MLNTLSLFYTENVFWNYLFSYKLQFLANEEFLQILMKCIQEISQQLRVALAPPNNPHIVTMRSLLEMTMQLRITQNHINVLTLLQKVVHWHYNARSYYIFHIYFRHSKVSWRA